ncbi:MAG: DUF4082 domain-containing protein [Saprospiraceae bacterium]|nr:DUF4082 domain-containing protein [Saprospiraceae bacterium]
MKTSFLLYPLLLCLSCMLLFCAKDKNEVEESPFFEFFNDASIQIDTVEQASDSWEYGFTFTPQKSGKVTKFGIKIPANGDYSVTFWDLSDGTARPVRTHSVSSSALHEEADLSIPEIFLEKDKKYGITVRSNSFYRITKPGNGAFTFPRTVGNIRIDSFNEGINNSSTPEFPTSTNDTRVAPCVNVIFIAD